MIKTKHCLMISLLLLMVALIVIVTVYLRSPCHLTIRKVIVSSDSSVIKSDVVSNKIQQLIDAKNFFTVNLSVLQHQLQGLPWVETASIRRQWPDSLVIRLQAQQLQAICNRKGLINRYGEVFYSQLTNSSQPSTELSLPALPQFFSDHCHDSLKMLAVYQQLQPLLQTLSLQIETIRLNDSNSWQLSLNNGMKLQLGQTDILTKVNHFVKVYPKVFVSAKKRARVVDLRYKNGMAVQWAN